jgi:DNA (cytosine-5)-methyltransferase 1
MKFYTFIDLFAGIGGMRLALEANGGKCVFSSEWDKNAQKTYFENFGEVPHGDIAQIKEVDIPKHDILVAGFPCQAFSIAGARKGFEDSRGTLFFEVARILKSHRPSVFLLENVKGLVSHNKGETFQVIVRTLKELDYNVFWRVLNAVDYGVPQNRERIYIVGFDKRKFKNIDFNFPLGTGPKIKVEDLLDRNVSEQFYYDKFAMYEQLKKEMVKEGVMYQWRRKYVRENKSNVCPTLTANMGTGGHNVPLVKIGDRIRKLTPKECLRFQGFPPNYKLPEYLSNPCLYRQIGNSVVVPVIQRIAEKIVNKLEELEG